MENLIVIQIVSPVILFALFSYYQLQAASLNKASKSISLTNEELPDGWHWSFRALLMTIGAGLLFLGLTLPDGAFWLLKVAGIGFIGVGIFRDYRRNTTIMYIHCTFASIGIGALALCPLVDFHNWIPLLPTAIMAAGTWIWGKDRESVYVWNLETNLIYPSMISFIYVLVDHLV